MSNSFDGIVSTDKSGNLISSKHDKTLHGLGLKNVKRILKDRGDFEYHIEGNRFVAKVVFY